MQPLNTQQQKSLAQMIANISLKDTQSTSQSSSSLLPPKQQQFPSEQLLQITPDMISQLNNLISFLRKGKIPSETKHFPITQQQRSQEWHEQRKIRLTGSNFKTYIHQLPASRLKAAFDVFRKETKEIHSKAIDYGVKNEDVARDEYVKLYPEYIVKESTLTIRTQQPWLGSSPDSLIYDKQDNLIGGIEIKCPYSKKDITVDEAIGGKYFYLKQIPDENGKKKVILDDKHAYYYQVQGQMMVLDLPWVDFVVRTEKSLKVVKVERDEGFIGYLRKELKGYYFGNYVWEVLKQYARSNYLKDETKYWMSEENVAKLVEKLSI